MTIDKICDNYSISREQRIKEMNAGLGPDGTQGFAETGCYTCDGYDSSCGNYMTFLYEMNQESENNLKL